MAVVKIPNSRPQSFFGRVSEIIGRNEPVKSFVKAILTISILPQSPTVDVSRVDYTLARAVFHASELADPTTNKKKGKQFILGAHFAKPIVNASAAFTIGKLPTVIADEKFNDELEVINQFFKDNKSGMFYIVRNCFRDGDVFLRVGKDLKLTRVPPWTVEKVIDPVTAELIGYDITNFVETDNGTKDKYVEELRKTSPFRRVLLYKDNGTNSKELTEFTEKGNGKETERRLPIVHFPNELEDDQVYGTTEYQNLYTLFANYHAVLENAVKNNIYNSTAMPYLTGVDNIEDFLRTHGDKDEETGEYKLNWDPKKFFIGGSGFEAKVVQAVQNANDADKLLNLFFWGIIQASETPEFVMGTAVSSSKASVEEQTPVMVKKAERKQLMLTDPLLEFVDTFVFYKGLLDNEFKGLSENTDFEPKINWPDIVGEDQRLNLDIVKALMEQGVITDKTAAVLLGLEGKVDDLDKEIKDAQSEKEEKAKRFNPFAQLEAQTGEEGKKVKKAEETENE